MTSYITYAVHEIHPKLQYIKCIYDRSIIALSMASVRVLLIKKRSYNSLRKSLQVILVSCMSLEQLAQLNNSIPIPSPETMDKLILIHNQCEGRIVQVSSRANCTCRGKNPR